MIIQIRISETGEPISNDLLVKKIETSNFCQKIKIIFFDGVVVDDVDVRQINYYGDGKGDIEVDY